MLPGETVVTHLGGTGRTIRGTLKFADGTAFSIGHQNHAAFIFPSDSHYLDNVRRLKTEAERQAFFQSEEGERERKNFYNHTVFLQPDGSFLAYDVPPGDYQLQWEHFPSDRSKSSEDRMYISKVKLVVPPAQNDADDSVVDWGVVELAQQDLPR